MAIPDFQSIMLPLLKLASDNVEHTVAECRIPLADEFGLTIEERQKLLPSGQQSQFSNRVSWAKFHLEKAGLLLKTGHGHFQISPTGLKVLSKNPPIININFLNQFPGYLEFRSKEAGPSPSPASEEQTPEEAMETAHQNAYAALAEEVLTKLKASTPVMFEKIVLELMLKIGYGGFHKNAGALTKPSKDGGIDGIINQDILGLDVIYLQAKKWENSVGAPEIQQFVGALTGKHATKGVFITTSWFTPIAIKYAAGIHAKVVLIDGERLARLMIDHNLGVSPIHVFEIKKIDSDYFADL